MYDNKNNNNNNNNNNIIIIIKLKKSKSKGGRRMAFCSGGGEAWGENFFFFFILFVSFSDLRKSDLRFSLGLKAKLIYVMRAMRGHQKVGVLTNSVRYVFYPT